MRIILAARDADLRLAMQLLLSEEPGVNVIGSVSDANGLLALINSTDPDLVLMDVNLPGQSLQDTLSEIGAYGSPPKIVLLGQEAVLNEEITQSNVEYYLQIGEPPEKLVEAFRQVVLNHEKDNLNSVKENSDIRDIS